MGTQFVDTAGMGWMTNFAKVSSLIFMDNMRCIGDLIFGGVCHRFPDLKFVSVGVRRRLAAERAGDLRLAVAQRRRAPEHPEYDLLPSEYFRRQIYGCFWFERDSAIEAIERFPDNIMFETDYPHPTCQHPGPQSPAAVAARLRRRRALQASRSGVVDRVARQRGVHLSAALNVEAPDLGSPLLVAHVDGRVLHLRVDRPERRNRSPRTCTGR